MNYLQVQPTSDNRYLLTKPFRIDKDLVIPAGYKTNGADIPRIFWWIIPPFKPKYLPAVVAHDWLCDKGSYKRADDVFKKMLFEIEKSFETWLMVKAVRIYHKIRYGV